MSRSIPPLRPARPIAAALLAMAWLWSGAATAQTAPVTETAPADGDVVRLSDAQRRAILDSNTVESAAIARGERTGLAGALRNIHGEVGVMAGSYGTRGIYGTADIPLGDHAGATVSFESSRYGYRR